MNDERLKSKRPYRVIIIGAGFGGIAAAIELMKNGVRDITILESANDIGGTWHYNDYPGSACDVPSHFYSYSFAQRETWSRLCSPQSEILDYIKEIAKRYNLIKHVRCGATVTACYWMRDSTYWKVEAELNSEKRVFEAEAVILATGQLNRPAYPKIGGIESFLGKSFHSARWEHDFDLEGKKIAVIGTGASAVQFIPEIAPIVAKLSVFQRTGNWFLPREHKPYPSFVRLLFNKISIAHKLWRKLIFLYLEGMTFMVRHPKTWGKIGQIQSSLFMRWQLKDPQIRRKIWPDYPYGCKRVLFSSTFLPALQRSNVELVSENIAKITPSGPQTSDGRIHQVDCIIYATGFNTNDFMFPMHIQGADGISLREAWKDGARAHLGISVSGFPSLFLMYGPNTNTSGGSIIYFLEAQAKYIRQAILFSSRNLVALNVRSDVETESTENVQKRFIGTAWLSCNSWYRDGKGRIVANWPGYMREYAEQTKLLSIKDFSIIPAGLYNRERLKVRKYEQY